MKKRETKYFLHVFIIIMVPRIFHCFHSTTAEVMCPFVAVFFFYYIYLQVSNFFVTYLLYFTGAQGRAKFWWVLVLVLLVTYQITGFFALHKIMIYIFLLLSFISKFLTLGAFNYRIRKVVEWCLHQFTLSGMLGILYIEGAKQIEDFVVPNT